MPQKSRQTRDTVLNLLLIAALLAFIFGNLLVDRAQSSEQSMDVLAVLSGLLQRVFGYSGLAEHFVRKLAHFCEFAALGFFTQHLWAVRRRVNPHYVLHGLFFGLLCAVADEMLQTLSDRSAQVSDVVLDFSGAICGSMVFLLLYLLIHRRRR